MRSAWIVLTLLFLALSASAATLHGSVYEYYSLEKLSNSIVSINSIPEQKIVAENGDYSFDVPNGNYTLHAFFAQNGNILYAGDQNVSIASSGNFEMDILVYPASGTLPSSLDSAQAIGLILALLAVIAFLGYRLWKPPKNETVMERSSNETQPKETKKPEIAQLDEKAESVLQKLEECGGRLTQKELRDKLPQYSEAMVSLIVAELESEGKVKKIKQGRGNIIVVK
ncbi:MAG: hypothetical protein V1847_01385 [Candidatus Diapherotrites archaeon]